MDDEREAFRKDTAGLSARPHLDQRCCNRRTNDSIETVDHDPVLRELNHWAAQLFASYYAFEAQGAPCWFDHEKGKADKEIMLDLIGRIVLRLQEINDGSLTIEDLETERLGSL